ncbi:MAG: hypothetical protein IJF96_05365 [Firmicutes bacterium]|nr:hypothetical protein [Bacillota bacterium]
MENIRIGIIAEDEDYAMALASGMTAVKRDLIVSIYRAGSRLAKADILLVEEKYDGCIASGNVVLLCRDREDQSVDPGRGVYKLWRYSDIREIVSTMIYIYTVVYGRNIPYVEKGNVRIHGFLSHGGGTGCTSVAMGVAQEMKRFHGRKVMYVSMEQISSASEYMSSISGGRTIAEYLYYCLARKQDVWRMKTVPVESFLAGNESGIESLAASPGRNPIPYLERDDIPAFFASIVKSGRYDTVIIDCGCSLAPQITDAIDICDSCCFVRDPERKGKAAELYISHLLSVLGGSLAERMVVADNRRVPVNKDERSLILDELFSDDEEGNVSVEDATQDRTAAEESGPGPAEKTADVIIGFDPVSFKREGGIRKIYIDRDFGVGMKEIAEKLIAAAGDS